MKKLFLFLFFLIMQSGSLFSQINLNIENIKENEGNILVAVYNSAEDFLNAEKAFLKTVFPITSNPLQVILPIYSKGKYAIAIFHDEDSNNKLNTYFGIPTEPYGFSQNKNGGMFGPPKFNETHFDYLGVDLNIDIKLTKIL